MASCFDGAARRKSADPSSQGLQNKSFFGNAGLLISYMDFQELWSTELFLKV